jgi:hypothetical protein
MNTKRSRLTDDLMRYSIIDKYNNHNELSPYWGGIVWSIRGTEQENPR